MSSCFGSHFDKNWQFGGAEEAKKKKWTIYWEEQACWVCCRMLSTRVYTVQISGHPNNSKMKTIKERCRRKGESKVNRKQEGHEQTRQANGCVWQMARNWRNQLPYSGLAKSSTGRIDVRRRVILTHWRPVHLFARLSGCQRLLEEALSPTWTSPRVRQEKWMNC